MIPPEQHAEIRRLFYAAHWCVRTIASTLGVHSPLRVPQTRKKRAREFSENG